MSTLSETHSVTEYFQTRSACERNRPWVPTWTGRKSRGTTVLTACILAAVDRVMRFAIMPTRAKNCPEGCLAANTALELGSTDPEAAGKVKKMFRGLEEIFGKAIKKGQKSGEITTRFLERSDRPEPREHAQRNSRSGEDRCFLERNERHR